VVVDVNGTFEEFPWEDGGSVESDKDIFDVNVDTEDNGLKVENSVVFDVLVNGESDISEEIAFNPVVDVLEE
jgi:archaellum component FlaF (FlaF/FlaG flagellin family)